ncbi:DUF3592 domain-containing protein [Demetria terragena]|uniref:DUF3592 domain-containing protein n=1 Tax=Demetria terragena TaxID=63959 RepID=UPI0003667210|nr:DUF3592 domain-containing protein [Demetria terragena]
MGKFVPLRERTGWMRFCCVALLVGSLGMLTWSAIQAARTFAFQQSSTEVTGTVVDVRRYASDRTRSGQSKHWTKDITFEYVVRDNTERGVWVNDDRNWTTGQRQSLLVDPSEPTKPRLAGTWGLYRDAFTYAGLAVVLALCAPLVWAVLGHVRSRGQSRRSHTRR